MGKVQKKISVLLLATIMLLDLLPCDYSYAKPKVKLSTNSKTLKVGQTAKIKLLNNKSKVKWSIAGNGILIKKSTKKYAKIKAYSVGKSYLKAKVGKKTYKCKITVEKKTSPTPISTEESYDGQVQVLAEYTLTDSLGWYTRHFMVIQNNSNTTLDISTSSLAYAENGSMVGAANGSFYALGAGCISVLYEAFETNAKIGYYDTNMKCEKSRYYQSVIQDLTYTQNAIKGGAVFQVTNNGSEAAEFVEGYVLFFKNGNLVDYSSAYFTDNQYEIKPGATLSEQIMSYEDFDAMQFYLTGRR